jgi:hypothetical protein
MPEIPQEVLDLCDGLDGFPVLLITENCYDVELIKAIVAPDMRQIGCQIMLATAFRRTLRNRVARLVGAGLSGEAGRPIYVLGNLCSIP